MNLFLIELNSNFFLWEYMVMFCLQVSNLLILFLNTFYEYFNTFQYEVEYAKSEVRGPINCYVEKKRKMYGQK